MTQIKVYNNKIFVFFILIISIISYINITFFIERKEFINLLFSFSILFIAYFILLKQSVFSINQFIIIGFIFRLITLLSLPNLSDDYFRFIWDGRLSLNGINPFLQIPEYYIHNDIFIPGISKNLFLNLNSPKYFTIYPPVYQFIFWLSVLFSPIENYFISVLIMKLFIISSEVISILFISKILKKRNCSNNRILIYALNPLVIIELSGNLHFEALMIVFLVLSIYFLISNKLFISTIFFSLAVCTKLLPLMFLPLFFRCLGWKKSCKYYLYVGGFVILFFIPFLSIEMVSGISKSANLYFQKFEFNASIYYIIRWIGYQVKGYNIIQTAGSLLSAFTFVFIMIISFSGNYDWKNIAKKMLFAFSMYFIMATIIHPWYVCGLIVFSVFCEFRFAIFWSGMVILSYSAYQTDAYQENLWLICLEYTVVYSVLFYELWKKKPFFNL